MGASFLSFIYSMGRSREADRSDVNGESDSAPMDFFGTFRGSYGDVPGAVHVLGIW